MPSCHSFHMIQNTEKHGKIFPLYLSPPKKIIAIITCDSVQLPFLHLRRSGIRVTQALLTKRLYFLTTDQIHC